MANLRDYLIGLRKTANDKFPLGKDLYAQMVKDTEQVDVPIEQIEAAGRADLQRNTDMLKSECATYLPKGSLAACVAKMDAKKPSEGDPGRRATAAHHASGFRSEEQRREHSGRPAGAGRRGAALQPRERRVHPSSRDRTRRASPRPTTSRPRIPNGARPSRPTYIPSEATLLFTSVHEVWPGHFLQFLHSNANPDKLEALWIGYAYAEGWAHYSEEMMSDEGLAKGDPEMHIGQLRDALLRDVRLLSSIGLHTEGMTRGAIREDVPRAGLPGSRQRTPTGRARHL